jgi:hypothetical protein
MNGSNARAMLNENIRLSGAILFCGDCDNFKKCPKAYKDIRPYKIRKGLIGEEYQYNIVKDYGWKPHKTTVIQYDNETSPSCEHFIKGESK